MLNNIYTRQNTETGLLTMYQVMAARIDAVFAVNKQLLKKDGIHYPLKEWLMISKN